MRKITSIINGQVYSVNRIFSYVAWLFSGRKTIDYPGYHCGCCGKWVDKPFSIPEYDSCGKFADTVEICEECNKVRTKIV